MMRRFAAAVVLISMALAGCRSAVVSVQVINQSGAIVKNVEFAYPTASFGRPVLADGEKFHYVFKAVGDGQMKMSYVGADGVRRTSTGPDVAQGTSGELKVTLMPGGNFRWDANLLAPR